MSENIERGKTAIRLNLKLFLAGGETHQCFSEFISDTGVYLIRDDAIHVLEGDMLQVQVQGMGETAPIKDMRVLSVQAERLTLISL